MSKRNFLVLIVMVLILIIASIYIKDRSSSIVLDTQDTKLHRAIQDYLDNEMHQARDGGKIFSSYIIHGTRKKEIYLTIFMQEYIKKGDELKTDYGLLTELVLIAEKTNSGLIITDYKRPQDGVDYGKDIKKWFTKEALKNLRETKNFKNLEEEADKRAKEWFNID